jgi:DNA-binding NarL/FixJ family response regulator
MRVLLIDDHPLIQAAVSNVLKRLDGSVSVDVASDCQGGLRLAESAEPDLLLLDLNLPGVSGIPALKMWRTRFPAVPVIVLSAASDRPTVLAALGAGAAGFIPKSSSNEVMLHAVRLVQDGGKYVPPEALSPPAGRANSTRAAPPEQLSPGRLGLTERQLEVLRLVASGVPNKLICRELGLAERTVKTHITAIFRALKVTSRTQAALAAAKLGISEIGTLR